MRLSVARVYLSLLFVLIVAGSVFGGSRMMAQTAASAGSSSPASSSSLSDGDRIAALEKQLMAWHKANAVSQRLASIPGIGPIIATAIATTVADPGVFRSGREFAAWLGLVPRQNSTGGKTRLGGITKRGNRYLRRLLINGASANLLRSKATKADPWVIGIRRRRPPLVVAVALANKTARIAWAVMLRQTEYQPRAVAA